MLHNSCSVNVHDQVGYDGNDDDGYKHRNRNSNLLFLFFVGEKESQKK